MTIVLTVLRFAFAFSTSSIIAWATIRTFASARFATWAISTLAKSAEVGSDTPPILMIAKLQMIASYNFV